MKTVIKNDEVLRVSNSKADELTDKYGYDYCPKSIWKKQRDLNKQIEEHKEQTKKEKKSKKKNKGE